MKIKRNELKIDLTLDQMKPTEILIHMGTFYYPCLDVYERISNNELIKLQNTNHYGNKRDRDQIVNDLKIVFEADRNEALLNIKHKNKIVRDICARKIKGENFVVEISESLNIIINKKLIKPYIYDNGYF